MVNLGLAKSRGSLPFKDEIASSFSSSQRGKNDQISRIEERNPGLRGFAQLRRCDPRTEGSKIEKAGFPLEKRVPEWLFLNQRTF